MANIYPLLTAFEAEIDNKEGQLVAQRAEIRHFVKTDHTVKETQKALMQVGESEAELNAILCSLLEAKDVFLEYKTVANNLCQRCRDLNAYIRDMNEALSADLILRHNIQEKNKIDLIQSVTFLFTMPTVFMTAAKTGFFEGRVDLYQAAAIGFSISAGIVFRKKIRGGFRLAARSICETPRQIRNSLTFSFVRESLKQRTLASGISFRDGTKEIGARLSETALRAKEGSVKFPVLRKEAQL